MPVLSFKRWKLLRMAHLLINGNSRRLLIFRGDELPYGSAYHLCRAISQHIRLFITYPHDRSFTVDLVRGREIIFDQSIKVIFGLPERISYLYIFIECILGQPLHGFAIQDDRNISMLQDLGDRYPWHKRICESVLHYLRLPRAIGK